MSEQQQPEQPFIVVALYKFVTVPDPEDLREALLDLCTRLEIMGTLLVASEGINGTISGTKENINYLIDYLRTKPYFVDLQYKIARHHERPFYRMKVKLKPEIVTMGQPGIDPTRVVGTYVQPEDWNELIEDPEVLLVDTRNKYEIHLGQFKGAVDPETDSFREFPDYVREKLDPGKHTKVAMYCTGGIRCEKSTAYLLEHGFKEVFHLQGGILNYLEKVPQEDSLWEGDCFVFDNRVTVDHNLEAGDTEVCPNCRMPVTPEDKQRPEFEENVSCHHCVHRVTESRRQGLLERKKQIDLARARGEQHIGRRPAKPLDKKAS